MTVAQVVEKFHEFYGSQRYIFTFKTARHSAQNLYQGTDDWVSHWSLNYLCFYRHAHSRSETEINTQRTDCLELIWPSRIDMSFVKKATVMYYKISEDRLKVALNSTVNCCHTSTLFMVVLNFNCADFHKKKSKFRINITRKYPVLSFKSITKNGKWAQKFITPWVKHSCHSVMVTKLTLALQLSLNNSYTKFNSNPTNGSLAHILSQTDK
jgi:hypothetical protein